MIKLGLGIDGWIGAGSWVWVFEVHVGYVLQEQCVLCRGLGPEGAQNFRLGLGALVALLECDDGLVVALDGGRHDADGAVQLRARHVDPVENVFAAGRLVDDLRQPCPLHQVLIWQLVDVPGENDVCRREVAVQLFHARLDVGQQRRRLVFSLWRVVESRDERVAAESDPVEFVRAVVGRVHPDGRLDGGPHIQGDASAPPPRSVPTEDDVALDADDAVRVFRLEVRLRDDSDVGVVARQVGREVLDGEWLGQSGGVQDVQRRRRGRV